jgi:hypothetical protein
MRVAPTAGLIPENTRMPVKKRIILFTAGLLYPVAPFLTVFYLPRYIGKITAVFDANLASLLFYWVGLVRRPARPRDFHTVIFKRNRHSRFREQPRWARLSFCEQVKPSEEREREFKLLRYLFHEPSWLVFTITLGFVAQRRRGERMSLYTYRHAVQLPKTARRDARIRAGFAVKRDFQTQRRRGERMSFHTYRGFATVVFELDL